MGSRAKLEISVNDRVVDPSFDEQFSLWLDLVAQLEASYPADVDAFAHEEAMDVVYHQKKSVETWLCCHPPASAFEAFCLVEIARREDDEMSGRIVQALLNTQGWLAQRVLSDFQQSVTPSGKHLIDRTFQLTLSARAAG